MDRVGIDVRHEAPVIVVALRGEVDHANVANIERELRRTFADAEAVVLDLAGVTWFDSAGIALLDRVLRTLGQLATPVLVSAPEGSRARSVLRIVAFDDDLLADDAAAAADALRSDAD